LVQYAQCKMLVVKFKYNTMYKVNSIKIKDHKDLKQISGWKVYFVDININMIKGPNKGNMTVHEKVFTNGRYISKDFLDINNHASLKREVAVDVIDNSIYNSEHLIYGNGSEPHKVIAISDPLCPFCQDFMPGFLRALKEHPGKIALYYYHLRPEKLSVNLRELIFYQLYERKVSSFTKVNLSVESILGTISKGLNQREYTRTRRKSYCQYCDVKGICRQHE